MTCQRLTKAVTAAEAFLSRQQRADGGWGYHIGNRTSFTEPTAWAVAALGERQRPDDPALARSVRILLATQNDDGGWANVAGMPSDTMTARVAFALADLPGCADAVARGTDWLVRQELPEGGWGWCYGTTGFLETATYAAAALAVAGRLRDRDRLIGHIRRLRCADGGWCSHVPVKLGFPQPSQPSVTPLGIVALTRLGLRPESDDGLRESLDLVAGWVERGAVTTSYTLAVTLWALREVGLPGPTARRAGEAALERAGEDGGWRGNVMLTAMMCRGLRWLALATT